MLLTTQEAFAMHSESNMADAINGHIGLLRSICERLDPSLEDEVQGNVKDFLLRQGNNLKVKLNRHIRDVKQMVGGEERYRELQLMWMESEVSHNQTWQKGYPADVDGNKLEGNHDGLPENPIN